MPSFVTRGREKGWRDHSLLIPCRQRLTNRRRAINRHLEIRLPVSGLKSCPDCHPERSEGSSSRDAEILRCAQDDKLYVWLTNIVNTLAVSTQMKMVLKGDGSLK